MSGYMCNHGHLYASCPICAEISRAQEEFILDSDDDGVMEYLYDHYLDLDERLMREEENN